jgi:hypothetical protein
VPGKEKPGRIWRASPAEEISTMAAILKVSRRDKPLKCASCAREVPRRARQQRFCSARCKEKARKAFLTTDTGAPANPQKKYNKLKALQRAKALSSTRILAPAHVLAEEVFNRPWGAATSSGGVAIEIGRLRRRALVMP